MISKSLITFAMLIIHFLGLASAMAQPPMTAQELINTTGLKQSRQKLMDGDIVMLTRPELESDSELHVLMSLLVPAPLEATVKTMQRLASGNDAPGILAAKEIKGLPGKEDLANAFRGISFEPAEIKEVQFMITAGKDGGYNLSEAEMTLVDKRLKGLNLKTDDPDDQLTAISEVMQEILQKRYRTYRQKGLEGMPKYWFDGKDRVNPSTELVWATESMKVLKKRFADYYLCLRHYPQQCGPEINHQFFWVKQSDGARPIFVLKHWVIDVRDTYSLITERQYYLSHTLNSMQVVIGCFPYDNHTLVVLLNQAFTEKVNMKIGKKIAKAVGYKQVEKNIRPIFEALRAEFSN